MPATTSHLGALGLRTGVSVADRPPAAPARGLGIGGRGQGPGRSATLGGMHRCTAVLLAAALAGVGPSAVVPTAAAAAPGAAPAATPAPDADPLADAQRLYDRGKAKFETADYADAIELWTEAYAIVPETSDGAQTKVLLLYNIATAREKQFDVSRDPAELRQAAILLESFERSIPTLYGGEGPEAEAERTKVRAKRAELEARLREHEAAQAAADDEDDEATPPPPEPTAPPDDDGAPQGRGARGLVIGGAVAAGLGVGGLGLMAAGLGMGARANDISDLAPDDVDGRRARFDRGRTGNALAIAGGVAGGVLLVTGAVLLGLGLRRARAGRASDVALVPAPARDGAALVLQGRF